ncbi:hypothetical protein UK99_15520 [Frankia casuarinae]|nr:hypothetical protein UK99_15520 [Frankia casuarinae]
MTVAGGLLLALVVGCSEPGSSGSGGSVARPGSVVTPSASSQDPGGPGALGTSAAAATPDVSRAPGPSGTSAAPDGVASLPVPTPRASSVFVGEACSPAEDTSPATAVNGLVLFCAPVGGTGPAGIGRWSTEPPAPAPVVRPDEGGNCDPEDVGRIVQDSAGRPVSCLRDPTGTLTWSDIS